MNIDFAREEEKRPLESVVVNAPFSVAASFLDPRDAATIEDDWRDLAANAAEPNPFFAPALLIPALAAFADETVRIALVRDERARLIALAPFAPARGYSKLPVRYLATWMHDHCFFAAPLIRRGREKDALKALFDLVEGEGVFLRLRHLDADGVLLAEARVAARSNSRRASISARFERALLVGGFEADVCLKAAFKIKKRKELRRLRARLEDLGALRLETLAPDGDATLWANEFLLIESAGWKGGAQTALASSVEGRRFFVDAICRAHRDQILDFHRLTLNGRVVAAIVNFIEGGAGYSFKIAYDEDFAKYSPGVLLEIDMLRALEGRAGLSFMDSCAAADHPMINSLWRERRAIAAINVSGKRRRMRVLFRILMFLERAGERFRDLTARKHRVKRVSEDAGDI
ncbi:MAG: GNAT family N-acetyltransferase [Parvularculaceae bacterium]|nr:GNAT family N-acetyltransferase [Parvularculaceae bacterium]